MLGEIHRADLHMAQLPWQITYMTGWELSKISQGPISKPSRGIKLPS